MHYSTIEHDIAPLWLYEVYFDSPMYSSLVDTLAQKEIIPDLRLVQVFSFLYVLSKLGKEKHETKKWLRVLDSLIGFHQSAFWK